jgi:putative signal transducing protein
VSADQGVDEGAGEGVRLVRVATVSSPQTAYVLAARLGSEGIECRLTGGVDSPYRLTMGSMAQVEMWIRPEDMEDAQTILLAAEVDDILGGRLSDERRPPRVSPLLWLAALVLLVVVIWVSMHGL